MVLHTHLQTSHSSRTTLLQFLTFLYIPMILTDLFTRVDSYHSYLMNQ